MLDRALRAWRQKAAALVLSRLRRRNLRSELTDLQTERFWSRRQRANSRRLFAHTLLFRLRSWASNGLERLGDVRSAVTSTLKACFLGALFLLAIVAIENVLVHRFSLGLLPSDQSSFVEVFPTVAVQVMAAFLGFYLATVGIVLGNAYHDVSEAVRNLVLDNAQTRLYLGFIGLTIGAGLVMVLLRDTDVVTFGYLAIGVYACLVCLSGWSFKELAFGAFDLLNPIELIREPIRILDKAVRQLGSRRHLRNDVGLRKTALRVNRALENLAEIIRLTKDRESVDRRKLAKKISYLGRLVSEYARNKHRIPGESAWFTREPSYPRWVEYNDRSLSIALKSSTPLPAEFAPVSDWLERRAGELIAASLEACVVTDDMDAALGIVRSAGQVAGALANNSRFDDATSFARIIADSCWNPPQEDSMAENATANAVASAPPLILTEALLGWKSAISSWPGEINRAVEHTNWDNPGTREVSFQGTPRVRRAAQDLLREVHSEGAIEKVRITPGWYLRSTLASECIISLREFADRLVEVLRHYVDRQAIAETSPEARAMTGLQALQMISKAELVAETLQCVVDSLATMQQGHDPIATPEVEELADRIGSLRSVVLEELGEAVTELQPSLSKSIPDYFGQTVFTLLHHTESAVSDGDVGIVGRVFPSVLSASLKLHEYVNMTYRPPTYEFTPANFNPILNVLELSGLALIYEELRDDGSAEPIRQAWRAQGDSHEHLATIATNILDTLDQASGGFPPVSMLRSEWETRIAQRIVEEGLAIPIYNPFEDPPVRTASPLIKMLNVMGSHPALSLDPYNVFAGRILAQLTGEEDERLRERPALRRYYEAMDRYDGSADPPRPDSDGDGDILEGSQ